MVRRVGIKKSGSPEMNLSVDDTGLELEQIYRHFRIAQGYTYLFAEMM